MEQALTEQKIQALTLSPSAKHTLSILVKNNLGERFKLVKSLTENNAPKFGEILKIKERIPDLIDKVGLEEIGGLIMAEITKFVNSFTVVRPMTPDQIGECAYAIISSSEEDRLSLEDLILFFDGAKQGKYTNNYVRILDHIDQSLIFEMMEVYRQERHRKYIGIKDEQHSQFKNLGDSNRSSNEKENEEMDVRKEMVDYYKKQWGANDTE